MNQTAIKPPTPKAGIIRFKADRRQLGGLLLLLGTCATIEPLTGVNYFLGTADFPSASVIQIASFAGGILEIVFGSLAMVVGYLSLIHDYGHKRLSVALLVLMQGAWVPFATRIYNLVTETSAPYAIETESFQSPDSKIVSEDFVSTAFIPEEYLPTVRDVQIVGSSGIVGEITYMTAFFGGLAFSAFSIYIFDAGKATTRDARYYHGRLLFYSFVIIFAGLSQLLLGTYILFVFGTGPLYPAISVAMYTVHYPEITMSIGGLQMAVGYFGIARYLGFVPVGRDNHLFQILIFIQWISMLIVQYIVQISLILVEDAKTTELSSMVLLSVGINILPAFLDFKMRTIPHALSEKYYGSRNDTSGSQQKLTNRVPRSMMNSNSLRSAKSSHNGVQNNDLKTNQDSTRRNLQFSYHDHFIPITDVDIDRDHSNLQHPLIYNDCLGSSPVAQRHGPKQDSSRSFDVKELLEDMNGEIKAELGDEIEYPEDYEDRIEISEEMEDKDDDDGPPGLFNDKLLEYVGATPWDPTGLKRLQRWKMQMKSNGKHDEDDSSNTPDDSTSVLEEKMSAFESEFYTDSMEYFRKSLTEIL